MAKARKGSKENPINLNELNAALASNSERSFEIREALIKDGFCHYVYAVTKGVGAGDTHKVKPDRALVRDPLLVAFAALNVHLAVIDDAFKNSGIEIKRIAKESGHELTGHYHVTGFKVKGSTEDESVILIGNKYVSTAGGRMELETPKITLDKLSSYKWYEELKKAIDTAREKVALYKEGDYDEAEEEVETNDPRQMTIGDGMEDSFDEEMEGAKA